MRERFEKLHDILYAHYNGVLITLLACVMVIGTAIVITIQPMQTLISCQNIINEVGEDKVAGYQKSTGPSDLFDNQKETTYKDTNEYKEKQSEIDWMNKRINEIDNHLMTTLTRAVSDFADAYTNRLLFRKIYVPCLCQNQQTNNYKLSNYLFLLFCRINLYKNHR